MRALNCNLWCNADESDGHWDDTFVQGEPMAVVNLDALIPREDFEVVDEKDLPAGFPMNTVQIRDLEKSAFFYNALRKPDFQREPANWSPNKIHDFVKTFLEGDLMRNSLIPTAIVR